MIQFRIVEETVIEWSDDAGRTWHGPQAPMTAPALAAWWRLLRQVEALRGAVACA